MAFDENLAERIQVSLDQRSINYQAKKMMGGLCFMVNEKMCIGIVKNELMCRVDPEDENPLLKKPGVRPMDFTGKPMKGYLFVHPSVIDKEQDLNFWIQTCLDFNPKAKSSKKRN